MAARIDPILCRLDALLDNDDLSQAGCADVDCRHLRTRIVPSTPAASRLCMLLRTHLQHWSVQEMEDQVDQSLVQRGVCRLSRHETPDDMTRIRWAHTLQPETQHRLVDRTAEWARQATATTGRTLRLDATCVQTEIPHPTDSGRHGRPRAPAQPARHAGQGGACGQGSASAAAVDGPDPASAEARARGKTRMRSRKSGLIPMCDLCGNGSLHAQALVRWDTLFF
jgi:hypothetical protein